MIRKNKWKLIISSIIILIPMLLGVIADKILPENIAVHWGIDGNADGFMNSSLIFIILPLIMLAVHWICMMLSMLIDKNAEQNKKIVNMTFWIIPFISLTACGFMFLSALGYNANISAFVYIILAISFIFIGNYMPKTVRNRTMGIKIKWTLANDENWNATHRFAGKIYVIVGILSLLAIPLPTVALPFILIAIIAVCVVVPIIYSYMFYKKQLSDGKATKEDYESSYVNIMGNKKITITVTVIISVIVAIILFVTMFTGKIEPTLNDTSLTVKASMWEDLTLDYEDIDSVEYRENRVDGERIMGVGTARLLIGSFRNDEFGAYTRYTYTGDKPCLVIKANGRTIVIGADDEQKTKEIYDRISSEISK
jgi:uncharacterized membrane protein